MEKYGGISKSSFYRKLKYHREKGQEDFNDLQIATELNFTTFTILHEDPKITEQLMAIADLKQNLLKGYQKMYRQTAILELHIEQIASELNISLKEDPDAEFYIPEFPLQTLDEVEELEYKLNDDVSSDPTIADRVIMEMQFSVARNDDDSIKILLDDNIITHYNYDGVRGKRAFRDLTLCTLYYEHIMGGAISLPDFVAKVKSEIRASHSRVSVQRWAKKKKSMK